MLAYNSQNANNEWNGEIYENNSKLQRYFGSMIIHKYIVPDIINMYYDENFKGLDIGCGDGYITNEISNKLNCRMDGIDISKTMIKATKKYENTNDKLSFIERDITIIDINSVNEKENTANKYFFIISFFCLQWIMDQEKVYHNISNLLIDGGKGYLLLSPKKLSEKPNYVTIIHELLKTEIHSKYFLDFCIQRIDLTKNNIKDYIENAGLIVEKIAEINEPFIFDSNEELSNFFQCIVTNRVIVKEKYIFMKNQLIKNLCDDVVLKLIGQGNFKMLDDKKIESNQSLLFVIIRKL